MPRFCSVLLLVAGILLSSPYAYGQGCSVGPIANVAGDTIFFTASLTTTSPIKDATEPLSISTSGGEIVGQTVSVYNAAVPFLYTAAKSNETITGTVINFDNDETCSIGNVTVNGANALTLTQRSLFFLGGTGLGSAGLVVGTYAAGIGCTFSTGGWCEDAILFTSSASLAGLWGTSYYPVGSSDPNYMVIAVPAIPTIPTILPVPGNPPIPPLTQAEADAFNALIANQAAIIAYTQAAITSANRAQGAKDVGNVSWQTQQTQTAQLYSADIGMFLNNETTLLTALGNAFTAAGLSINVTPAQVSQFQQSIATGGLSDSCAQALATLGASQSVTTQVATFLVGQNGNTAVNTFPNSLVSTTVITLIASAGTQAPLGQCAPFPLALPAPAGPNGAFVILTSSDPNTVTLQPGSNANPIIVFIPAGATTPARRFPQVCGISFGTATVTVSGGGLSFSELVHVTATLSFTPPSVTMTTTRQERLTLNLSVPAPANGLTVNLTSEDPGVVTVPPTVTIPGNSTSVTVPITGVKAGSTVVHASALPNVPDTTASVTVM